MSESHNHDLNFDCISNESFELDEEAKDVPSPFLNPNGLVNKLLTGNDKNKHFSSMDQGARSKPTKKLSTDRIAKLFNHSNTLQSNDSDRLNAIVKHLPLEENAEQF